jgi:hypothetical protein
MISLNVKEARQLEAYSLTEIVDPLIIVAHVAFRSSGTLLCFLWHTLQAHQDVLACVLVVTHFERQWVHDWQH